MARPDDRATSRDAPSESSRTENTPFWQANNEDRPLKQLPFRQRLQSLPLIRRESNLFNFKNHTSEIGNQLSPDDGKKQGGLKGLFRKASVSMKNRQRRFSQMSSNAHSEERTQSPWHRRLRTATSFNRNSRYLADDIDANNLSNFNDSEPFAPVPGSGTRPPRIPKNGGFAARQNAALHNGMEQGREISNPYLTSSGEGDRESAIAMPFDSSDHVQGRTEATTESQKTDVYAVASSTINRDFISSLPTELGIQILSHIDTKTLRGLFFVCRRWHAVARSTHVWRDVFLREETQSYATGIPIPLGGGLGLPAMNSNNDWMALSQARHQLRDNWEEGTCDAFYLHGHLDSIYCVQFDENKIITGSRDKTIRVWNLEKLTCSLVIGPPSVVEDPSFTTDMEGRRVHYVASNRNLEEGNRLVRGLESTPKTVSFPMHHEQSILCLQYDDEILVTGSSDSTCIVYDLQNGYKPMRRLLHHTEAVLDLAFDKRYIVTCSKDLIICVWDRQTGGLLKQLLGHTGPVNAVQLRGNTIVSCSGDFTVKMWNIETGNVIQTLRHHTKGLACCQFSEDSKYIASAGNDKLINVWNANTHQLIYTIDEAHDNLVRSLHIDSISGRLVSGSYDTGIKVFSMETGQELLHFPHWHTSWILGAKSDYRRIISTGQDPKILILDFGKGIKHIDKLRSETSRIGLPDVAEDIGNGFILGEAFPRVDTHVP
ncbi:related to F-box/WD repeat-containing protein 7 [Rhynchosporium graminicola]|uniref:Related to F-box/WD repeat-containing protein 7 n=1 Tax=Rhynchosporium graminicola TaxID=2792576 RepID=A0A1E1K5B5_9HELO|nr:related to F-box/WD repeat-containing protein 7 [Rhynchosporium commune]